MRRTRGGGAVVERNDSRRAPPGDVFRLNPVRRMPRGSKAREILRLRLEREDPRAGEARQQSARERPGIGTDVKEHRMRLRQLARQVITNQVALAARRVVLPVHDSKPMQRERVQARVETAEQAMREQAPVEAGS